jgi:hypothetical protein
MVAILQTLFGSVVASRWYYQATDALKHVGMGCTVVDMNPFDFS